MIQRRLEERKQLRLEIGRVGVPEGATDLGAGGTHALVGGGVHERVVENDITWLWQTGKERDVGVEA
jgi:hypothetical protein